MEYLSHYPKGWSSAEMQHHPVLSCLPPTNDKLMVIIQKLNTVPQWSIIVTPYKIFIHYSNTPIHLPLSPHLTSSLAGPHLSPGPSIPYRLRHSPMKRHTFHSRIPFCSILWSSFSSFFLFFPLWLLIITIIIFTLCSQRMAREDSLDSLQAWTMPATIPTQTKLKLVCESQSGQKWILSRILSSELVWWTGFNGGDWRQCPVFHSSPSSHHIVGRIMPPFLNVTNDAFS